MNNYLFLGDFILGDLILGDFIFGDFFFLARSESDSSDVKDSSDVNGSSRPDGADFEELFEFSFWLSRIFRGDESNVGSAELFFIVTFFTVVVQRLNETCFEGLSDFSFWLALGTLTTFFVTCDFVEFIILSSKKVVIGIFNITG